MSLVVDTLEENAMDALPGETDEENASYLRELAHRLTLTANDLDPAGTDPAGTDTAGPDTA